MYERSCSLLLQIPVFLAVYFMAVKFDWPIIGVIQNTDTGNQSMVPISEDHVLHGVVYSVNNR